MAKDLSSTESITSSTLEHILVARGKRPEEANHSSRDTETYSQSIIYRPTYHIRKIKSKGAILVLVWNFLLVNLFYYLYVYSNHAKTNFIGWILTLPIAGWLADVYFGRYKVIHCSMWVMWVGSILATVSSVVAQSVESYAAINNKVMFAFLAVIIIGFGGYQANIIQFGIDQLHDASTDEIKSFITWFVWTYLSSGIFVDYVYICKDKQYKIFGLLFVCACVTIVLCLSLCLNSVLVKEPVIKNPFKLVYNVVKYAIKNKHPRYRGAFTYCEDEYPSRMDLGKCKYGGPFTTEQVEDVKTFLRLQIVAFFGCTMFSGLLVVNQLRDKLIEVLLPTDQLDTPTPGCYFNSLYIKLFFYSAGVLIPLNEFIIRPLLQRYFYWMKSFSKFSMGVVLQIVRVIILAIFITLARHNFLKQNGHDNSTTIQCLFLQNASTLALSFDYRLMALPSFINSISITMFGIGGVEFICAQTPYSMRGLISGASYGSVAVFTLIGFGISYPFTIPLSIWNTGLISCGFWYLLLFILYLTFNCIVLCVFRKLYKNRKREDVLPNEQIFAERYYGTQ